MLEIEMTYKNYLVYYIIFIVKIFECRKKDCCEFSEGNISVNITKYQ